MAKVKFKPVKQHASNYNYKGKRSFGQRIKNFFTIPEEDLKEEPSKEFEKIKLFTLTRGSLFLGILVFMILINILVGFNINFLYLRQILGFLFLILIPGLLIMLCFKIRTVKFWEYLVYTVGLSIAFIMFAGLAVNWTLPALGITDKPLSLWPILICFDMFLLGLWLTAIYRNKDLKPFDITIPKLDTLNRIFFIIPMIFPLLSILGAFLLNNHGPNILTMIMLGGIAIYVLLLIIFRKRMNENVWPWALYWIGLALLLMYSMRSWYVFGADISGEYGIFTETLNSSLWKINSWNYDYSSMLSITLFPTIIQIITLLKSSLIVKLLIQIFFPLIAIIIFLQFNKFNKFIAFLSSLFFIFQTQFFTYSGWTRQEIALMFFGLMLLVLFTKEISLNLKKFLFVIFGASMIVSHYSTAYIALAIFILTYMIILIYKIHENQKIKKGKIYPNEKYNFYLTGILILLLLLFGFLWYSQITPTGNGLITFTKNSLSNMDSMFNKENQQAELNIFDQLNPFYKKPTIYPLLDNYKEETKELYLNNPSINLYRDNLDKDSNIQITNYNVNDSKFATLSKNIYMFGEAFKKLMRILLILGIIFLIIDRKKLSSYNEYFFILISGLLILSAILFLPLSSLAYSMMRLYQQILIINSFLFVLGTLFLSRFLFKKRENGLFFTTFLLILYFLLCSNFIYQAIGGIDSAVHLSNSGLSYDSAYTYAYEVNSAEWISLNKEKNLQLYSDPIAEYRLMAFTTLKGRTLKDILPWTIDRKAYVYLDHSNTVLKKGLLPPYSFLRMNVVFNFPTQFLVDNKNKVYNNGGSEIFK